VTWVRISDDLFTHDKFNAAWEREPPSVGLWLFAASHSGHRLLDGAVPGRFVRQWFTTTARERRATQALVEAGLWVPNGDGWTIHDWTDYNPTREIILAKRAADSARKSARNRNGIQR
jgi:hypothetical protein